MSAADKREELEAQFHQALAEVRREAIGDAAMYIGTRLDIPHLAEHLTGRADKRRGMAAVALAKADEYAEAYADQRVNRLGVADLRARLRLAEATADAAVRGAS